MDVTDKLTGALQENLITLLGYDDEHGRIVSNLIDAGLFEGDYRIIAERCLDYWRRHGKAPKAHTADLFADIIEDKKNRKAQTYKRILSDMLSLSKGMNVEYVVQQVRAFSRQQRYKALVLKSHELFNSKRVDVAEQIEILWNDALRAREVEFDAGRELSHVEHVISYLNSHNAEFTSGVPLLDRNYVVPERKTVSLWLAPSGFGKSWALIHTGKQNLLLRKKILHVSLEMAEEKVIARYYQSLFAISKRDAIRDTDKLITHVDVDRFGRIQGFDREETKPDFTLKSPKAVDLIEKRLKKFRGKLRNLKVKQFPTRSLTVNKLRAYLDNLEIVSHFIPDMVILDYVGIMNTKDDNYRISLGRVYEELRGLAVERNFALVTAHQTSKVSAESKEVKATHVAEDWSLIATSDQVMTYSQTAMERKFGLARLYASKARDEGDKFSVLVTQNYWTGQFCIENYMMNAKYFDLFDAWAGTEDTGMDDDPEYEGMDADEA